MTNLLKNPIFHDETKAREWLEARVWPNGRNLPALRQRRPTRRLHSLRARRTVLASSSATSAASSSLCTVGTVFERSKIPLTKWLAALFLMTASKKGVSAHQVHRMFGMSYKSRGS